MENTDMTVQEFYSGFNLDWMTEEERQTIYTATELYAKGKLRQSGKERAALEKILELSSEWDSTTHNKITELARQALSTDVGEQDELCSRCGKEKALKLHSCPYKSEINDDDEFSCNCCESCTHECAMDI